MNSNLQERLSKIDDILKSKKVSDLLAQKTKSIPAGAPTAIITAAKPDSITSNKPNPIAYAAPESTVTNYNYFTENNSLDNNLPIQTNVNIISQKTQKVVKANKKDGKDQNKKQHNLEKNKPRKDPKTIRKAAGEMWEDTSLLDWPDNDFRIFCGNLGNEVTDEMLANAFRKYSSFSRARVIRDKRTSKTKGFGFVALMNSDDYIKAMKEMNGQYVGNRPVKLTRSSWKERSLASSTSEVQELQYKKVKKN